MNYSFSPFNGTLTIDGFAINPGLTQFKIKNEKRYTRDGDAQQYEWYVFDKPLIHQGTSFKVTLIFEAGYLVWVTIAPPGDKGAIDVPALIQLKDDLAGPEETFPWGTVTIPGIEPEEKSISIRYSATSAAARSQYNR